MFRHIVCAVKHITLADAMERPSPRITQQQLEDESGVDRTRISRLLKDPNPNVTLDTYNRLVAALQKLGALKKNETLTFGSAQLEASR